MHTILEYLSKIDLINVVLLPLVLGLARAAWGAAPHLIKSAKDASDLKNHELVNKVKNRAIELLWTVMQKVEQTIVREGKIALADGRITKEEYQKILAEAKATALEEFKKLATAQGIWDILKSMLAKDAVDAEVAVAQWTDTHVEALVGQLKPAPVLTAIKAVENKVDAVNPS